MRCPTSILLALGSTIPLILSAPGHGFSLGGAASAIDSIAGGSNTGSSGSSDDQLTCSAPSQTAQVVPFAQEPAWITAMTNCLYVMNNSAWNGAECKPADVNGAALGPSFGFYKVDGNGGDGQTCFNNCEACLMAGINASLAVTTSCKYGNKADGYCIMGFNYGT